MFLGKVLPIHIALRDGVVGVDRQRRVPDLDGEPVLEIQQADLADVLEFAAGLANLRLLEPRVPPRTPPEHREGPRADLALLVVHRPRHADIGVVAETGLADDGEVGALPAVGLRVSQQAVRHWRWWLWR